MSNLIRHVSAVVVLYKPESAKLIKITKLLSSLNIRCYLIDNTPADQVNLFFFENLEAVYIQLGKNEGIAVAQNIGIKTAIQSGAKIIILLDQDSETNKECLELQIQNIESNNSEISVPTLIDRQQGFEYPNGRVNRFGLLSKVYKTDKDNQFQIDVSISSGSVIAAKVFQKVGYFEESLFIDYVDTEWYFRCWLNGVLVKCDPRAKMFHSIGEKSVRKFGVRTFVHSSERSYFKIRNPLKLIKFKTVPMAYVAKEIVASICHSFVQIPLANNPLSHIRYCLKGLKDGFCELLS